MARVDLSLKILIFDKDEVAIDVLKAFLVGQASVKDVYVVSNIHDADQAFSKGFNCLFIDIFSFGAESGIRILEHVRHTYPHVPICLHSHTAKLMEMPDIPENWRKRFIHYYKLPKDTTPQDLKEEIAAVLISFDQYLERQLARSRVEAIIPIVNNSNLDQAKRNEIEDIVAVVQQALEPRDSEKQLPISVIVPGMNTGKIEDLINSTLHDASQSLKLTTNVNISVLAFGSFLVLAAFIVASITGRVEAVAFGGFGMAGIIAALIANPLKSIGVSARRLVQVQVAYLGFVSQLALLNKETQGISQVDRSQRLGEEVVRTLKALEDHFGK